MSGPPTEPAPAGAPAGSRTEAVTAAPLLIVGAPRSGTTWLQNALLRDRRVCGGQESHFFVSFGQLIRKFDRGLASGRPHGLGFYWTRRQMLHHVRAAWRDAAGVVAGGRPEATLLLEKTPDHARFLPEIAEVLPAARVVHVVRDGRDVAASLIGAYEAGWGRDWAPRNPAAAARMWARHVRPARVAGAGLPAGRYLEVRYEDLRADRDAVLAGVYRFVGLAEPTAEDLAGAAPGHQFDVHGEAAATEYAEPAGFSRDASAAPRRRLAWWERRAVELAAGDLLRDLGYPVPGAAAAVAGAARTAAAAAKRAVRRSVGPAPAAGAGS